MQQANPLTNSRGLSPIVVIAIIGILIVVAAGQGFLITESARKAQWKQLRTSNQQGLIDYILTRSVADLKGVWLAATPKTLNTIFTISPANSLFFTSTIPKVYGKGQFQIDVDDPDSPGNPIFESPESDVSVWIDNPINTDFFLLTISTNFCRVLVNGRVKFAPTVTGLGTNWNPACPADQIAPIRYTAFVNQSYWTP